MHILIALIFAVFCLVCMAVVVRRPNIYTAFIAVSALFSLGYYAMPMVLIDRSELRYLPESELVAVITMALMFFVSLVAGFAAMRRIGWQAPAMQLPALDTMLERYWWGGAILSNAITIAYNATATLTFYQTQAVEEFVAQRSVFSALLSFFAMFAKALAACYLARSIVERSIVKIVFCLACMFVQVAQVIGGANRLLFITPMVLAFAAIIAMRQFRTAGIVLSSTIAALLVFSPFAVALRAGAWNSTQDIQAKTFTYGQDPVDTVLQSIVDRGDILNSMAMLKTYTDRNGRVGLPYYMSVAVIPIPRAIFPDKPAILSADGRQETEASVLVWRLKMGNSLGSLTAFGAVVAYREGGWGWVPVNGVLAGALFAIFLGVFGRGGIIGHAFFAMAFLSWAIQKVPPSLMEAMATVMTYLPLVFGLYAINWVLMQASSLRRDRYYSPYYKPF